MRTPFRLFLISLLLTIFAASQGQAAKQPGSKPQPNIKVQIFLRDFQRATTVEQASAAFKRGNFSKAELAQLETELKKQTYSGKINSLKNQRTRMAGTKKGKEKPGNIQQILRQKNSVLAKQHKSRLDRANRTVKSRSQRLGTMMHSGARARPSSVSSRALNTTIMARALPESDMTAEITDIEPRLIVGQQVTIRGIDFGSSQGRVAILVGEDMEFCSVSSWRHNRIVCTVPDALQPDREDLVSGSRWGGIDPIESILWVKLHGGETGPYERVPLYPDISRYTPEITSIHPTEVYPGSDILIEGSNFFDQPRPARIEFTRERFELEITEWTDGYIRARMPRLSSGGYFPMDAGMLRLETSLGHEATRSGISFVPEEEIVELNEGPLRAACHPKVPPLLCLIGDTNHFTRFDDLSLADHWSVDEAWLVRQQGMGPGYGAYFEHEPETGSTNPTTRVAVWADAWSITEYRLYLTLKGPKGTRYFR
jgi:hypothetical protein